MGIRSDAEKVARKQDAIARRGFTAIRRELLRAANTASRKYTVTGQIILPEDFRLRLWRVLEQIHTAAISDAVTRTQRLLKTGAPKLEAKFDWPELVKRFVFDFAARYMGQKVTTIETTLIDTLMRTVSQGMLAGEGQDVIAKRLTGMAGNLTKIQARRIARTEVHGASGFASMNTAEIAGDADILVREWVATEDDRTRVAHNVADGQRQEIGEPFQVGGENLMYPGDPSGSAGNVINCRCVAVEVLREA